MEKIIYVKLLDEGTPVYQPVKALKLKDNLFKILDKPSDDEIWEFQFNEVVSCLETKLIDGYYMVAVNKKIVLAPERGLIMKIIRVPKTALAQEYLDFDQCEVNELIELNIEGETFYRLFESGFFNAINILINSNIDDYEDESIITIIQLSRVVESGLFDKKKYDKELFNTVKRIRELFNEALKYKTGVYFYF